MKEERGEVYHGIYLHALYGAHGGLVLVLRVDHFRTRRAVIFVQCIQTILMHNSVVQVALRGLYLG